MTVSQLNAERINESNDKVAAERGITVSQLNVERLNKYLAKRAKELGMTVSQLRTEKYNKCLAKRAKELGKTVSQLMVERSLTPRLRPRLLARVHLRRLIEILGKDIFTAEEKRIVHDLLAVGDSFERWAKGVKFRWHHGPIFVQMIGRTKGSEQVKEGEHWCLAPMCHHPENLALITKRDNDQPHVEGMQVTPLVWFDYESQTVKQVRRTPQLLARLQNGSQ
jgi:hypothetical protein